MRWSTQQEEPGVRCVVCRPGATLHSDPSTARHVTHTLIVHKEATNGWDEGVLVVACHVLHLYSTRLTYTSLCEPSYTRSLVDGCQSCSGNWNDKIITKCSCNHLMFPHALINTPCNLHPQVGQMWYTLTHGHLYCLRQIHMAYNVKWTKPRPQ